MQTSKWEVREHGDITKITQTIYTNILHYRTYRQCRWYRLGPLYMDEYGKSILAIDTTQRRYDPVIWGCCVGALAIST